MSTVGDVLNTKGEERPAYVSFHKVPVQDKAASEEKGMFVARDVDFVHVTPPYSKDVMKFKVKSWFAQLENDLNNGRIPEAWVNRYKAEYQAWQNGQEIPLSGTAIKGWGVISPAQQETLIRANVRTVEDAAGMNDEALKRFGMGGVDIRHKARAWLSQMNDKGPLTMENAALKARTDVLEGQVATLTRKLEEALAAIPKAGAPAPAVAPQETISAADLLDDDAPVELTSAQLREMYAAKFGKPPHHRKGDASIREDLGL